MCARALAFVRAPVCACAYAVMHSCMCVCTRAWRRLFAHALVCMRVRVCARAGLAEAPSVRCGVIVATTLAPRYIKPAPIPSACSDGDSDTPAPSTLRPASSDGDADALRRRLLAAAAAAQRATGAPLFLRRPPGWHAAHAEAYGDEAEAAEQLVAEVRASVSSWLTECVRRCV